MTIDDVLKHIKNAHALTIQLTNGTHCAVCYKRAAQAVSIHEPRAQVIPLCGAHFAEVEAEARKAMKQGRK
jgi:hypothetical protein